VWVFERTKGLMCSKWSEKTSWTKGHRNGGVKDESGWIWARVDWRQKNHIVQARSQHGAGNRRVGWVKMIMNTLGSGGTHCNPSIQEAATERLQVWGHPRLHSETMSQTNKTKKASHNTSHLYSWHVRRQRLRRWQFEANPGEKSMKPPSQPIKAGHGGTCLSTQLHGKNI
jgi:hypothetical protein